MTSILPDNFDAYSDTDLVALAKYRGVDVQDTLKLPGEKLRSALLSALRSLPEPKSIRGKFAGKRIIRAPSYVNGGNPRNDPTGHGFKAYEFIPRGDYGIRAEDLLAHIAGLPPKTSETYGAGGKNHLQWDLDRGHTIIMDDPGWEAFLKAERTGSNPFLTERVTAPITRPYDGDKAWAIFTQNAEESLRSNSIFESKVQHHRYRVESIEADRIVIARLDADSHAELTRGRVELAAERILQAGGRVARGTHFYTVAKEAAFVLFHPAFRWDTSGAWIELVQHTPIPRSSLVAATGPAPTPVGRSPERTFRAIKGVDYAALDASNRKLGLDGELLVVEHERDRLRVGGREDLAEKVVHTSKEVGDGRGYDVLSFDLTGAERYIEVKTTKADESAPFFMSANELAFAAMHSTQFVLYRIFDYDELSNSARFRIWEGDPSTSFVIEPVQFCLRAARHE